MVQKPPAPISAVFGVILLLLAFVVFLLVYDDLRSKPFVQGTVGVVMSLIVAVVLFSIVYSRLNVRNAALWGGVISGGGAALFYLLLLPQIKPFFFPGQALSGYVYYKRTDKQQPLKAVKGVIVLVPSTAQESAETDDRGYFAIDAVYPDEKALKFRFGGNVYDAPINAEREYEVIPPLQTELANKRDVTSQWQKNAAGKCDKPTGEYKSATAFTLQTDLSKDAEELSRAARYMHVAVALDDGFGDLAQPKIVAPANGMDFTDTGDQRGRNLGWRWSEVDASPVAVNVGVCVKLRADEKEPRAGNFHTVYWFGVRR